MISFQPFRLQISFIVLITLVSIKINAQDLQEQTKIYLSTLDDENKVTYLENKCWQLREKSTDSALIYGKVALRISDSLGLYEHLDKLNNYVGVVYMHYIKDIKRAIPYYHRALESGLKTTDTIQIAYAYNNLGDAYYLIGNTPLALQYGEQSLYYFNKIRYIPGIAYSYINLGMVSRVDKKYDLAIHYFQKAIDLRKEINQKIGIASAIYEIGLTYFEKKDNNKAMEYFTKSLQLNKDLDNKMYMALSLNGIGDVLFSKGKYKEALNKYKESLLYNEKGNHIEATVQNKLGIALVHSKMGNAKEGLEQLNDALKLANTLGFPRDILDTYKTYADFYENINDYESSVKSYKYYLDIYDSLYYEQQFEVLSEMQNKFQITLNLNKTNQDLEAKKTETLYLTILIFLFVIGILILFWRYRINKNLSRKLSLINESKDKLFSIVSHDLKTPFNSMLGFSDLLVKEADKIDNKRIENYSRYINDMSRQSVSLIDNLMNWSRSQRDQIKLNRSNFNLGMLVDEVINMHLNSAKQKDIDIQKDIKQESNINADQDIIRVILANLISNAIKFTNEKGTVNISIYDHKSNIDIIVKDTGIGISSEDINKIFTVKENYTTAGTNNEKGTGLGLIICKEFAVLHGGSIQVKSNPGEGSEFIVTIPK